MKWKMPDQKATSAAGVEQGRRLHVYPEAHSSEAFA